MLDLQPFHQRVGDTGIELDLKRDRYGNQEHMREPARDVVRLKGEDEHQSGEQRGGGNRRALRQQHTFKPVAAVLAYQSGAEQRAGDERWPTN
jgi:hypothetical protein